MITRKLLLIQIALSLVFAPSIILAKNMHGKFGVGGNQTLLGVTGISFAYWSSPELELSLTLGSGFVLDPDNNNTTTVLASAGFQYVLIATKYANLSLGVRADVGWASKVAANGDVIGGSNVTQWGLEIPIEVEYFFSDSFSIQVSTGAHFTMVPSEGAVLKPGGLGSVVEGDYKGVGLGVGSLFGGAGFRFYF